MPVTKVIWEPFHPGHFALACFIIFIVLSFVTTIAKGGEPISAMEWGIIIILSVFLGAIFTSFYDDPYGVGAYIEERRDC